MRRIFALVCLGTVAIATGCNAITDETPSAPPPSTSDNVFDPAQVQPGDRVLNLEVVSVDVAQLESQERYVGTVVFEGETTLSGTYSAFTPADTNESFPCFNVDEDSAAQLPRFPEDERNSWFCFDNAEAVQQALGEPANQQVTIVIDSFEYAYIPSDVTNMATFIRVAE